MNGYYYRIQESEEQLVLPANKLPIHQGKWNNEKRYEKIIQNFTIFLTHVDALKYSENY